MSKKVALYSLARASLFRHPNAIVLASCVIVLVASSLFSFVLYEERQDAFARAAETARNLTLIVERDVTRNIEIYDLSLKAIADSVRDDDPLTMAPQMRRLWLFDHASKGRYLQGIFFLDAKGDIAIEADRRFQAHGNFADRDYFQVHRDNADAGLYVSVPYRSRLRGGVQSIAFSRRVTLRDGSFGGVVAVAVNLNYFSDLLAGLRLRANGTVTLLRTDGAVIMRYPDTPSAVGLSYRGKRNFNRMLSAPEGMFSGTASLDGTRKLYVFRKLDGLPLILSVAPAEQDIYAAWVTRAWFSGILAALLSVGFVALSVFLSREFQHRLAIEAKLRCLSRTDSVTGLLNRRSLDDSLLDEWRRACRTGQPLALLFIDIDAFKHYNDTYGHQRGDDALATVAGAVRASIRRPGDIAGRYGGEEFLVVLPDTASEGAHALAGAIHDRLGALAVEHSGSEYGTVTVSIGLAVWRGAVADSPNALIDAADEALYRAKAEGRNRTVEHHGLRATRPLRGHAGGSGDFHTGT